MLIAFMRFYFSRNHAGKNGTQRQCTGQLLSEFKRSTAENRSHRYLVRHPPTTFSTYCSSTKRFIFFGSTAVNVLQVFPIWDRLPGGWQDLGDGRPLCNGEETGFLRHHCGYWADRPWSIHPTCPVFLHHQEEPDRLHPRHPAGSAHLTGHLIQVKP